jgi:hypothetical protein
LPSTPTLKPLEPANADHDYGNFFPSLHVRYALDERSNLRAAFSSAIARPNFFDLVPFRLRDGEELVLGNPDLDPTLAYNLDLMFEHYDARVGVVSVGAFYRRLNHPIVLFTEDNELAAKPNSHAMVSQAPFTDWKSLYNAHSPSCRHRSTDLAASPITRLRSEISNRLGLRADCRTSN